MSESLRSNWIFLVSKHIPTKITISCKKKYGVFTLGTPGEHLNQVFKVNIIRKKIELPHVPPGLIHWGKDWVVVLSKVHDTNLIVRLHQSNPKEEKLYNLPDLYFFKTANVMTHKERHRNISRLNKTEETWQRIQPMGFLAIMNITEKINLNKFSR